MYKYFNEVKTQQEAKELYRKLCKLHHPDITKNPADNITMAEINAEYEKIFDDIKFTFKNAQGEYYKSEKRAYYNNKSSYMNFINIINQLIKYSNVNVYLIGEWLWCDGETKPIKELLKNLGFKWASLKKMWFIAPENTKKESSHWSFEKMAEAFGCEVFKKEEQELQKIE